MTALVGAHARFMTGFLHGGGVVAFRHGVHCACWLECSPNADWWSVAWLKSGPRRAALASSPSRIQGNPAKDFLLLVILWTTVESSPRSMLGAAIRDYADVMSVVSRLGGRVRTGWWVRPAALGALG